MRLFLFILTLGLVLTLGRHAHAQERPRTTTSLATNLTPWPSDINGSGYSLTNANSVRATNIVTETVSGTTSAGPKFLLKGSLGTDDTWNGTAITNLPVGATIEQWSPAYLGSGGKWLVADANGSGTFPAIAIIASTASDGTNVNAIVQGVVRNDAWAWTVGGSLYLSTTAGEITQTPPSGSGEAVQRIGVALSADSAYFNLSGEWGVNE